VECSEPIEETPRQLQFHDLRDKLARTNFQRVPAGPLPHRALPHGKFYRRSESVFPSSSIKLIGKRDYSLASSFPGTGKGGGGLVRRSRRAVDKRPIDIARLDVDPFSKDGNDETIRHVEDLDNREISDDVSRVSAEEREKRTQSSQASGASLRK